MERILLTNNPLLVKEPVAGAALEIVAGLGLGAVFAAALEMVQNGYRLLSAPLPPNVPLIRAPYRSLLLEKNDRQYDAEGIKALTKAAERVETLERPTSGEKAAADAAFIDREFLLRTLRELGAR